MTVRTIAPHRHAIADVHDIICYYREQAGTAVAENFAIEIDEAYARLIGPWSISF
jgi:plasmid stabilization system protein ParE